MHTQCYENRRKSNVNSDKWPATSTRGLLLRAKVSTRARTNDALFWQNRNRGVSVCKANGHERTANYLHSQPTQAQVKQKEQQEEETRHKCPLDGSISLLFLLQAPLFASRHRSAMSKCKVCDLTKTQVVTQSSGLRKSAHQSRCTHGAMNPFQSAHLQPRAIASLARQLPGDAN